MTGRTLCGEVGGHDDVINAAECVVGATVAISTSGLVVGPGSNAIFCARGEVVRTEETAVVSITRVGGITSSVMTARCGVHVTNNKGYAVAMRANKGLNLFLHFISAREGIIRAARGPISTYEQEVSVPTFKNNRGNPTIRI